ncbi:M56 family metallopeptidase [Dyadobacter sp. CY261]|uniref:M56 family metallopeptidase n=1 Tax=Dyadobacter sp. CY261 TaxID=2907203 RepID=UPI001F445BFC|nr:M56 family metallopeptidase [Dyadobacter sp. CY261]MCF0074909.1 M56 family metallopeptidase [Dyadobacter sp. CY261]
MEALPYLVKVNICWLVFYGCYWLLFRKYTFFMLNRAYLLFSLVISFVIPTIELQQTVTLVENASIMASASDSFAVAEATASTNSTGYFLPACYYAGVVAMLIGLIRAIHNVFRIVQHGIRIPMQGYNLVISQRQYARIGSFSFLKWIIISNDDYEQNFEPIFAHEMVHIRQWHTLDILLVEMLKVAFWFNPALWLYKRALQDTHEFLADEQATDRDYYATFLLSYAKSAIATSVANQFFNSSLLKKRIHMIYQNRTATWLRSKYLLLLPVFALAVVLMAARKFVYEERNIRPKNAHTFDLVTVKGIVTDESGVPVSNAAITFSGSYESAVTTTRGGFEANEIPRGSTMTVEHDDFLRYTQKIRKSNDECHIRLESNTSSLLTKKDRRAVKRTLATNERARILLDRWPVLPNKSHFIASTLRYPKQALIDGVEGQVSVSFLIDTVGNVSDPKIEKGVRNDLDNEAMRVVRLMPRWRPAEKNFKPVAVRYTTGIAFNIAVDSLPLAVKEKTPGFWGNRSIYSPAKTGPIGDKLVKEVFEQATIDLRDSTAPTTTLHRYGYGFVHRPLKEKPLDMRVKLPKK